jgi:hypothetical protein
MDFEVQSIFQPSVGVDIVFNINSTTPYSRSSIIYDTDFKNQTIIIAQPLTPLSKNTQFNELHLSVIIHERNRKLRIGIPCKAFSVIDHYTLANDEKVPAVKIKYGLPAREINIRSAYRLPMTPKFIIKGKILFQNLEFYTSRDFSIRDISLAGIGIIVPKKKKKGLNPLLQLQRKDKLRMGVILINMDVNEPVGTLPLTVQVARVNSKYSESYCLVGLKIVALKRESESILNKFIHDAQVAELKRLSRRNL